MLLEMGLVAAGVPFGWLWRNSARVIAFVGRGLTWTVRLMLFLLGAFAGGRREPAGSDAYPGAASCLYKRIFRTRMRCRGLDSGTFCVHGT